jgi:hypothetical protein
MAAPRQGDQNVRGYVCESSGTVCALGADVPAYEYNSYRFYVVADHGFPLLAEIVFDVTAFDDGRLYATNVRAA